MSLDGASNFYYYGKPSSEIHPTLPPGQKITTQLPADVAKIRIAVILLLTALECITGRTIWRWPAVILGITLAAYVAYKHLLTPDPLVKVFYELAGGKENYDRLPEIQLDRSKKLWENCKELSWNTLGNPVSRFTTSDGRKGMVVKGLGPPVQQDPLEGALGLSLTQTQAKMIFVEKLSPNDVPRTISNLSEWVHSALAAIAFIAWENPFSTILSSTFSNTHTGSFRTECGIYASISTDVANEFIAQRGTVNKLEPRVVEIEDDLLTIT